MFYDQENDQHVCFPCAHKEAVRLHEVEVARAAIVDAADKHFDYLPETVRRAVDHWRNLKGGA
jgi:hypothetical protein